MPDVPELFGGPSAVDQTGNLTVWAVKTIADISKPKLTELAAGFRITYSFLPGGYNISFDQEKKKDERLTAPIVKESLGVMTPTVPDLKYVDSTAPGSAAVVLADGGKWFFVERRNVPQPSLGTVSDKVRVLELTLGEQVPAELGDGKFALSQPVALDRITTKPVALVA